MKNLKFLALAALFAAGTSVLPAQVVLPTTLVSYALPVDSSLTPTPTNETLDASGTFGLGSGLTASANFYVPGYLTVNQGSNPSTLGDAVSDSTYYSFTVTPTAGDEISLTNFDLSSTTLYSNDNDQTFVLESSVNGFGSNAGDVLATYASTTTGTDVPLLGTGFADQTGPIEFRLYGYGGNNYYLSLQAGPIEVDGIASPDILPTTPEPTTWVLLGLGVAGLALATRGRRNVRI